MGLLDAVSFLSVIPTRCNSLERAASSQHWFPIIGLLLGAISGGIGWILSLYVDALLSAVAALATLYILTGLHHTDGLADFADGLMGRGNAKKRLQIMRDKVVGTGGISAIMLCVVCFVAAASQTAGVEIFVAIVISEVAAKYAMVVMSYMGRPAAEGTGALFCSHMDTKRLCVATALWAIPVATIPMYGLVWPVLSAVAVSVIVLYVAKRTIGGITGDVFGATHEISRVVSIAVIVSI